MNDTRARRTLIARQPDLKRSRTGRVSVRGRSVTTSHALHRHGPGRAVVMAIAVLLFGFPPGRAAAGWSVGEPIVTYWEGAGSVALTDAVARQAVDGGFNLVWVRSSAQLDLAQQYGLRGLWDGPTDDATIARIRSHPAHYGYYVRDEPSAADFPGLRDTVARLGSLDPDHVAYINLFPNYASNQQLGTDGYQAHLSQYMSTVRPALLAYDHYHLFNGSDGPNYFKNLAIIAHTARQADIPFINTVQASAWFSSWRVPNEHELRFLNYTTLAYGGQGISYWAYNPRTPGTGGLAPAADGTPTSVYAALSSIHPEFAAIARQVQPFDLVGAYHLGDLPWGFGTSDGSSPQRSLPAGSPFTITPAVPDTNYVTNAPVQGMVVGLFGPGDQPADTTFALVVNLDYTRSRTTTLVGRDNLLVFDAAAGAWSPTGTSQASLNLAPGGGVLVRTIAKGDANSDGYVDYGDLASLAPFFGHGPGLTWRHGDFDGNGWVNMDDLDLMALGFIANNPAGGTQGMSGALLLAEVQRMVPEPSSATIMATMAVWLAARRRATCAAHDRKGRRRRRHQPASGARACP